MQITGIITTLAACIAVLASCSKQDSDPTPGGYYVKGITSEDYGGANATAQLAWNSALYEAFGNDAIFQSAANDKKAIDACDKVYELNKNFITISFELYFQEAAPAGKTGAKKTVKKYDPAK